MWSGTSTRLAVPTLNSNAVDQSGFNRSAERWCPHHAAHRGSLNVPALPAGSRVERNALTPRAGTAINANKFPLFVAEGKSTQKKNKIRHNAYLYQSFKVLTANAQQRTHCFFIFGHSLGENDYHILRRLGRGRFKKLYVGIFGDLNSDGNRAIIRRATAFAAVVSQDVV